MSKKIFEYKPDWVKTGIRVKVLFNNIWFKGTVVDDSSINGRGVDIRTDKIISWTEDNMLMIPVYMQESSEEDWNKIIRRIDVV